MKAAGRGKTPLIHSLPTAGNTPYIIESIDDPIHLIAGDNHRQNLTLN